MLGGFRVSRLLGACLFQIQTAGGSLAGKELSLI
jgi:hypothetical protein